MVLGESERKFVPFREPANEEKTLHIFKGRMLWKDGKSRSSELLKHLAKID